MAGVDRVLGFLASHRGSNMQAIIDACRSGRIKARPGVVISNNTGSGALARAAAEGIPAVQLSLAQFRTGDELDRAILDTLRKHHVGLVVLAGYMKRIGPRVLSAFPRRIINIHPSLLPKYSGAGMYGLRVHEAVIAAGDRETGVTVHIVDNQYDTGTILAQRQVPVLPGDTAEILAARVLPVEHELYVETLAQIMEGEIDLDGLSSAKQGTGMLE
jgi:phosphoribosylglycinamide formyltransferase-1